MNTTLDGSVSVPIADLDTDHPIGRFPEGLRLVGTRCNRCGTAMLGERIVCSNCVSEEVTRVGLPETGTLYSFTRIHVGGDRPRAIGYVDLDGVDVRTLTDLSDASGELRPDTRVGLVTDGDAWHFTPIDDK